MTFADELKEKTKTKEQLEAERLEKEKEEFRSEAGAAFAIIKNDCSAAAAKGEREVVTNLRVPRLYWSGIDSSFHTKETASKYAEEVKRCLIAEGVTDVRYKVESWNFFGSPYLVKFTIRW